MNIATGIAIVCHKETGEEYNLGADRLTWETETQDADRQMGPELVHIGTLEDVNLGILTWEVYEYPAGAINHVETNMNGHSLIDNFIISLPLDFADLDESSDWLVEQIIPWFMDHYNPAKFQLEDPDMGPHVRVDGRTTKIEDLIGEAFPGVSMAVTYRVLHVISNTGSIWEPVDIHALKLPEIPDQETHFQFAVGDDGKIQVVPGPPLSNSEADDIGELKNRLESALKKLMDSLSGHNMHPDVEGLVRQYHDVLTATPFSIDKLYAEGIWFESVIGRKKQEIEKDNLQFDSKTGAELDLSVVLHGQIIMGTQRGQELLNRAREYAEPDINDEIYRMSAQPFVEAIENDADFVSDEAKSFISRANAEIGKGQHPQKSSHISRTVNANLLSKISKIVTHPAVVVGITVGSAILGAGVVESIPGQMASGLTTDLVNVVWHFITSHIGVLRDLAAVSGPDLRWLDHFLNWIEWKMNQGE